VLATKAELSGDGFDLNAGKAGAARERHSWAHLRALCAGTIETRTTKTVEEGPSAAERAVRLGLTLTTGLPLAGGGTKAARVEETSRRSVIELSFVEPARRVRVFADDFDYSLLGPAMAYSAELNFRLLVARLRDAAPRALRGRGARAILDKRPSGETIYASLEDLARELRWLTALAVLGARR
jgi:hypothetical protein